MATVTPVRAAGGVVWRPRPGTGVQVCLVHRPRYDDWTLPKGKLEPGEHPMLAAVREVGEEADVCGVPQVRLPQIRYRTRDGLPKVVDFWSMRAVACREFQPNDEVDEVRWLTVDEAARLLTYRHDVGVVAAFADLPEVTNVLGLVRHALAGKRSTWSGPDSARPLDASGQAQARELAPLLALLRPQRLLAASVRRCVQTLDPVAGLLDMSIEVDSCFDEPAPGRDGVENALAAAARLTELAQDGQPAPARDGSVTPARDGSVTPAQEGLSMPALAGPATPARDRRVAVVCSQGKVMPRALACLAAASGNDADSTAARPGGNRRGSRTSDAAWSGTDHDGWWRAGAARSGTDWRTPKGGGWLLAFHGARLVAADRL